MSAAGYKLRQARQRAGLTYRDVETSTTALASAKLNPEFAVSISRLSEIENHGVVPSLYRIYSLCAVYGLDYLEVLQWYGLDVAKLGADRQEFQPQRAIRRTHLLGHNGSGGDVVLPIRLDPGFNPQETTHLTRMIQAWGTVPLTMLKRLRTDYHHYGYVGLDDWRMHPLIPPGSLVQIDMRKHLVESGVWRSEYERPIYFVEYRDGYYCAWCSLKDGQLTVHSHPLSPCIPETLAYPQEVTVLGQVVGVAKQLVVGRGAALPAAVSLR